MRSATDQRPSRACRPRDVRVWSQYAVLAVCCVYLYRSFLSSSYGAIDGARLQQNVDGLSNQSPPDVSADRCSRPHWTVEPPSPPFPQLGKTPSLPARCLDDWLTLGRLTCGGRDAGADLKLDIVWTWVNGSDPIWRQNMARTMKEEGIFSPGFHYRDLNELRYSMRSVVESLYDSIAQVHLVVADRQPEASSESVARSFSDQHDDTRSAKGLRIVQTPHWLTDQPGKRADGQPPSNELPSLHVVAHSDIFHLPSNGSAHDIEVERQWRAKALPSFNSKSIESRIGWIPQIASDSIVDLSKLMMQGEAILSLNDDFFLLRPHAMTDFYSLLFGPVLRFDDGYYQQVRPKWDRRNINDAGETGGLWHANHLLSKRFPRRLRPYLPHVPKVVTRSLHHEAALMFKDDLFHSTQRRFRESLSGRGDIQLQWLLTSLRVERWREALLWAFIVVKLGWENEDGMLDRDAMKEIAKILGNKHRKPIAQVVRGPRETLAALPDLWKSAGLSPPRATELLFCSLDGHVPPILRHGANATETDRCDLNMASCFGSLWTSNRSMPAADLFTRVAFEQAECGDCLIMALVTASGPRGLSSFMPPRHAVFRRDPPSPGSNQGHPLPPPVLPMSNTWQAANFSLAEVMRDHTSIERDQVELRSWVMRLLARYLYVTGRSSAIFHMIGGPDDATRATQAIDQDHAASMLGLNDNEMSDTTDTRGILGQWFEQRWPTRSWWEQPIA